MYSNQLPVDKKRALWADIAKGLAIILVIMGHTFAPNGSVCAIIYLFHMPVFFFLAGYFMNFDKYSNNFKEFLKISFQRILVPAIFTFVLFYNVLVKNDVIAFLYAVGKPLPKIGVNSIGFAMWFLFCLICVRILLWVFLKIKEKLKINEAFYIILLTLIAYLGTRIGKFAILPWSLDIALVALYIAYAGYLSRKINIFNKPKVFLILLPFILILGYIDYKYFGLSMNERYYSKYPLASINIAILLSIALIYISVFFEKVKIINKFLAYLGTNSIIIMVLHIIPTAHKYHPIIQTAWRLLICIICIELFSLIPILKKAYNAKSLKECSKES